MARAWQNARKRLKRAVNARAHPPARFDEFKKWLIAIRDTREVVAIDGRSFGEVSNNSNSKYWKRSIKEFARDQFAKGKPVSIDVTDDTFEVSEAEWPAEIDTLLITISSKPRDDFVRSDLQIRKVRLKTKRPVRFVRCMIGELLVDGDEARVVVEDCYVAKLTVRPRSLSDLRIEGGALLRLGAPSLTEANSNPFVGRTTVRCLYLPRDMAEIDPDWTPDDRAKVIYEYRNARSFLAAKNDGLSAGVFHAAELALEREQESWPSQCFSYIYELGCDFGNSISRPVKAVLSILIFITLSAWALDAVEPALGYAESYGWQKSLHGDGWGSGALRALTYSFQSVFNPLGVLSSKALLVAKTPILSFPFTAAGLGGTLCIAFLVIALRRRFRLE